MAERTFAAWVKPTADLLRERRAGTVAFARSVPEDAWSRPSGLERWTCKDLLAHIGKANDMLFQSILRSVIEEGYIPASVLEIDTDGDNNRKVAERRDWPAGRVIDEVEAAGEEVQDLLSQLTDEHEDYRQEDPPFILSGFVRFADKEDHDGEHLAQLRAALEGTS